MLFFFCSERIYLRLWRKKRMWEQIQIIKYFGEKNFKNLICVCMFSLYIIEIYIIRASLSFFFYWIWPWLLQVCSLSFKHTHAIHIHKLKHTLLFKHIYESKMHIYCQKIISSIFSIRANKSILIMIYCKKERDRMKTCGPIK